MAGCVKRDEFLNHVVARMVRDGRFRYFTDPLSETFELAVAAVAEMKGIDESLARQQLIDAMMRGNEKSRTQRPRYDEEGN